MICSNHTATFTQQDDFTHNQIQHYYLNITTTHQHSHNKITPHTQTNTTLLSKHYNHTATFTQQDDFTHNQIQHYYLNITTCLLYTSDAADEEDSVDLAG